MKTILMIILAAWFAPLAGAQNNPAPAPAKLIPAGTGPAQPSGATPAQPSGATPDQPSGATPAQPSGATPAQPSGATPAQPSVVTPAQPSGDTSAQPMTLPKPAQTTPDVLTTPESPFFRPFHNPATAQITTQGQIKKPAAVQNTVAALKIKQAAELKALRVSLKDRPNAEINKAVAARKAEQNAAIQALEATNKTEAEKNQKVKSKPAKKTNKKPTIQAAK